MRWPIIPQLDDQGQTFQSCFETDPALPCVAGKCLFSHLHLQCTLGRRVGFSQDQNSIPLFLLTTLRYVVDFNKNFI